MMSQARATTEDASTDEELPFYLPASMGGEDGSLERLLARIFRR